MKISRLAPLLLLACVVISHAQQPGPSDMRPPNFSGDDPATLLRQLADLRNRLVKSEFETTAAYEARIVEEKKKPILDRRTIADTFYLVANGVVAKYDADTQTMRFSLPLATDHGDGVLIPPGVDIKTAMDLSQVAMYEVFLRDDGDHHVFFDTAYGLSDSNHKREFTATAKLDVEEAKRLKTATKAILIVRFEEPFARQESVEGGQFMTQVINVQFFDQQTGRVIADIAADVASQNTLPDVAKPNFDYSTYKKNPTFKQLRILAKPDAGYTDEARRNNVRGKVLLRVMFAETGQVTQISVVKGLPFGLTERAIAAARLIKFEPAELEGKKVAYPLMVVYNFRPH